jgi:hypothetical protein
MRAVKLGIGAIASAAVLLGASPALAAGTWAIVPAPPTGQNAVLEGVTAPSDGNAWAAGYSNAAANGLGAKMVLDHWNGSAWSQVTAPPITGSADLLAVNSSGTNDAWAVGYSRVQRYTFYPLAVQWNGTSWSINSSVRSALPGDTILNGVTDISSTDAYAFGNNSPLASGELAQWNGSTWSQVTYPLPSKNGFDTTLNAIAADSPNDVWIIGSYLIQVSQTNLRWETFSDHWNGSTWTVVPMPKTPGSDNLFTYQVQSMDVISSTNVWMVGGSGDNASPYGGTPSNTLIEHYNGTAWSVVTSPDTGTNDNLTGVTETSPTNLTAVGYATPPKGTGAQTLTMTWNGTAWAIEPSPNAGIPSVLTSVSTAPGDAIVQAVGYDGSEGSWNPLAMQNG